MIFIKKKKVINYHSKEQRRIYSKTSKPKEYIRVDKPKTDQEKRQVMFNNWCKAKKVYCGSYLPVNHKDLLKKGWISIGKRFYKKKDKNTKNLLHRPIYQYKRKSTNQKVEFHREFEKGYVEHYHWVIGHKRFKDRYGKEVSYYDPSHHLVALDMDYTEDNDEVEKLKKILRRLKYVKHRQ